MFRVHKEQKEALAAKATESFPHRLLAMLREHFPDRCAELGEPASLALIEQAIDKAAKHSLTGERDVAKYVSLAFLYGLDFDDRTWAREVLHDPYITAPSARAHALYTAAMRKSFEAEQAKQAKQRGGQAE